MAATGPSDFHGDCGRVAERHVSRGQETGAGRQGGRGQRTGDRGGEARGAIPSLHNRSRKEIPPHKNRGYGESKPIIYDAKSRVYGAKTAQGNQQAETNRRKRGRYLQTDGNMTYENLKCL